MEGQEILAYHAAVEWALAPDYGAVMDSLMADYHLRFPTVPVQAAEEEPEDSAEFCLDKMRVALEANQGFSEFHDRLAGFLLVGSNRSRLFDSLHETFYEDVALIDSVKPWMKKWLAGKHYRAAAWDARGSGYSNSRDLAGKGGLQATYGKIQNGAA